jgi:hypothetical protein
VGDCEGDCEGAGNGEVEHSHTYPVIVLHY